MYNYLSIPNYFFKYSPEDGMEVCIFDAKIRKDEITLRWLGTAVANIYFYHGTVVKVNTMEI